MKSDLTPLANAMPLERLFEIDCCVSPDQRRKNSASCYARKLPHCSYRDVRNGKLAICASGPSAKDYVETLRTWSGEIWAINGAFGWLLSEGVPVNAFVGMDPEAFLTDYLRDIPDNATYYISNQCHPDVFDRLKERNVRTWHADDPAVIPPVGQVPIPGGSTCLGRSPYLASFQGWQHVHLFGGDSSFDGDSYAYGGTMPQNEIVAEVNGTQYRTNRQMLTQAAEMVELMKNFPGSITLHGRGLLPAMAEDNRQSFEDFKRMARKLERAA